MILKVLPLETMWYTFEDGEAEALVLTVLGGGVLDFAPNWIGLHVEEIEKALLQQAYKHKTNRLVIHGNDPLDTDSVEGVKTLLQRLGDQLEIMLITQYSMDKVFAHCVRHYRWLSCADRKASLVV